MSEGQLLAKPLDPPEIPPFSNPAPTPSSAIKKDPSIARIWTGNARVKSSSLPTLRSSFKDAELLIGRAKSVTLIGRNSIGPKANWENWKRFSRDYLGLPPKAEESDVLGSRTNPNAHKGQIRRSRASNIETEITDTTDTTADDKLNIESRGSAKPMPYNQGGGQMDENRAALTFPNTQSYLVDGDTCRVRRTDNGFKLGWPASKPVERELQMPGVLEIDSVDAPPGALERSKIWHAARMNPMHKFTNDERRILMRIEARLRYLSNPRFPSTKRFLRRVISNPETIRNIIVLPPLKEIHPTVTEDVNGRSDQLSDQDESQYAQIVAIPSSVTFTDYEPHSTYQQEILIKNVSRTSRRFRLTAPPPYLQSRYFSLQLVSAPANHGTNGLVAPGMSLRYKITFRPDSLGNFRERFLVSIETGETFDVPVIAQRGAPKLTLPGILDCGPSRGGYKNVRIWDFKNEGGPGRFLIVPKSQEVNPYTIFDSMDEAEKYATASHGPFEVFPAYLQLKKGDSGQIIVRYLAPVPECADGDGAERIDRALFKLVCDNCTVTDFPVQGVAQKPVVKVSRMETPIGSQVDESSVPISPGFDVYLAFGDQNPHAESNYQLTVKNGSMLRLPFIWSVVDAPGQISRSIDSAATANTSFHVYPPRGWLPPKSEMTFRFQFKPGVIKHYEIICNLLLLHNDERLVDWCASDHSRRHCGIGEDCALSVRCTGTGIPFQVSVTPPMIQVPLVMYTGTSYSTHLQLCNESVSSIKYVWELHNVNPNSMTVAISEPSGKLEANAGSNLKVWFTAYFPGVISGMLGCRVANGPTLRIPIAANVTLRPETLVFDTDVVNFGLLPLGCSKTVTVPLVSNAPMPLQWAIHGYDKDMSGRDITSYLTYEPSRGTIQPHETQYITVTFVPTWYENMRGILECQIIDRGSLMPHYKGSDEGVNSEEALLPKRTYTAAAVEMRADVDTPRAAILDPHNAVSCFLDVPFSYKLTLCNLTMLPAQFRWRNIKNDQCRITFQPFSGEMRGGERREILVTVTGHHVGQLNDVIYFCEIEGMVESGGLLGIKLSIFVKDAEVTFEVQDDGTETQRRSDAGTSDVSMIFDFGVECPIFECRRKTLVIRNRSAISVPYHLYVQNYSAMTPDEEDDGEGRTAINDQAVTEDNQRRLSTSTIDTESTKGLLPASNLPKLGFSSKTGMEYIIKVKEERGVIRRTQHFLREGRGAAFHAAPSAGVIGPFASVRVHVTSYNNLVGTYNDNLVCEVERCAKKVVPIRLGVVGLPIRFKGAQLVASRKEAFEPFDKVNFGTRINHRSWSSVDGVRVHCSRDEGVQVLVSEDADAIQKAIQLENQSPRTVVLKWAVYIKHTPLIGAQPTLHDIIAPGNRLSEDDLGVFGVSPPTLVIQPFKTNSFTVFFRGAKVGAFDGLLVADVGYIESDGAPIYGLGRQEFTTKPATDSPLAASQLSSMACLRIQAKCIEPLLTLENDRIRIKRSRWHAANAVNAFLRNNTDAVCSFTLKTIPEQLFKASSAKTGTQLTRAQQKSAAPKKAVEMTQLHNTEMLTDAISDQFYVLLPTEQMLLFVEYIPPLVSVVQENNVEGDGPRSRAYMTCPSIVSLRSQSESSHTFLEKSRTFSNEAALASKTVQVAERGEKSVVVLQATPNELQGDNQPEIVEANIDSSPAAEKQEPGYESANAELSIPERPLEPFTRDGQVAIALQDDLDAKSEHMLAGYEVIGISYESEVPIPDNAQKPEHLSVAVNPVNRVERASLVDISAQYSSNNIAQNGRENELARSSIDVGEHGWPGPPTADISRHPSKILQEKSETETKDPESSIADPLSTVSMPESRDSGDRRTSGKFQRRDRSRVAEGELHIMFSNGSLQKFSIYVENAV